MVYTKESKLRHVLRNPIGADLFHTLLSEMGLVHLKEIIFNPITHHLRLKHLPILLKGMIDMDAVDVICHKMNHYSDEILSPDHDEIEETWWKEGVCYQIYPRSFKDSNGDGIGDLGGIIEKLDYLYDLGIDILWLSPIYDSPNDDNGYDIRDYHAIMKEFGTMDDFDRLLKELHQRDMRLIMDLVINHTSDEHQWFLESKKSKDSKYRNYYFWKDGIEHQPPNNWKSIFEGDAWEYDDLTKQYYLHLFSKKQVDLNWGNEEVRKDIYHMVNWWLEKGIDGFRLDVINFISKEPNLPDGNALLAEMTGVSGIEHYVYGPKVHDYLKELYQNTFMNYDVMTVGECQGIGLEMSKYFIHEDRKELNMIFNFEHMDAPGKSKWDDYHYDLNYLKDTMIRLQSTLGNSNWNSIFFENHDAPRMINKITHDMTYRDALAKLIGVINLTLRGTPFIYQGQEIGMINPNFHELHEFRDVETLNLYHSLRANGLSEHEIMRKLSHGSRDNSRAPLSWCSDDNAGFTSGTPWMKICDDYKSYNVDAQVESNHSILNFYRSLIRLRKDRKIFVYGSFEILKKKTRDVFAYYRHYKDEQVLIVMNLSDKEKIIKINTLDYHLLLSNYENDSRVFKPYEARIYD